MGQTDSQVNFKGRFSFDLIYESLEKAYGRNKLHLEAIMSVILGLKEKGRVRDIYFREKRNY